MATAGIKTEPQVNPELDVERKSASFDQKELTHFLDEGAYGTDERHDIEELFITDPRFTGHGDLTSLSYDEMYTKAVEMGISLNQKLDEQNGQLPGQIPGNLQFIRSPHIVSITNPLGNPMIVHSFMFIPAIQAQGTEEQQAYWLNLANSNKIIGTYAQTELGHGTNIRGLETTATYDPQTDEFILHSPTLTSTKFWPGGLGRSCNYGVVIAQLYTKGKCCGIHLFIVQLRSLKDHVPLPGITIGEVGPKMGYNAGDNGYLRFDHVRIPRKNMLMKYAKVERDGTYIKPLTSRSGYGTLIMARVAIVLDSALRLAQAVTIAVRYSAVRRQGSAKDGEPESKILDYQTHQYRLFPQVAASFGFIFVFKALRNLYLDVLSFPSPEKTAELHALSSVLKALSSQMATSGVEQCRLACGGLGYLMASRLPTLYSYLTASCTYDGENMVMLLQTARFLVKSCRAAKLGEHVSSTVAYLTSNSNAPHRDQGTLAELAWLFETTTAKLIAEVSYRLSKQISDGIPSEVAWNDNSVELVKCAKMHGQYFVVKTVSDLYDNLTVSLQLKAVLRRLFELLSIYWMKENAGDFLQYGGITYLKLNSFNSRLVTLLSELRKDMVALVDSFDFRDAALNSVIGCYDGRVYERVYDYVSELPSNQKKVHDAFETYLKPMMKSHL